MATQSMHTHVVTVPADGIVDWTTFHSVFAEHLGFPAYYGRNMNAWIDCLTYADDPGAGMLAHAVQPGELLTLRIEGADAFANRCPEQYKALIDSATFVNMRRMEMDRPPVISLLLCGRIEGQ